MVTNKIDDHYVDRRKIDALLSMFKPEERDLKVCGLHFAPKSQLQSNQTGSGDRTNGLSKLPADSHRYVRPEHVPDEVRDAGVVLC